MIIDDERTGDKVVAYSNLILYLKQVRISVYVTSVEVEIRDPEDETVPGGMQRPERPLLCGLACNGMVRSCYFDITISVCLSLYSKAHPYQSPKTAL